jgi:hypothetical protein
LYDRFGGSVSKRQDWRAGTDLYDNGFQNKLRLSIYNDDALHAYVKRRVKIE